MRDMGCQIAIDVTDGDSSSCSRECLGGGATYTTGTTGHRNDPVNIVIATHH
ncbi:hypothetical protein FHU31_002475 [Mycolicibacterium fluoranthenivorans]|uniref:Uncharacterized protein n=1 Tax=Mycolicibacterium fluoranthenivorans TaxID=258505 RepID=A0A7X5ZCX6_9MYCO|nr:hypothetical protein [Mycolicibacterium fluoranthenivorans]